MGNVDEAAVLDLLAIIDDDGRIHASATALASSEEEHGRHESIARENAMPISRIRRDRARSTRHAASRARHTRRFDGYTQRLVDSCLDINSDAHVLTESLPRKRRCAW